MKITIPLIPDEKGYIDRKCPNENCNFIFKVKEQDCKKLTSIFCPLCGHHDSNINNWITDEQYQQAVEHAKNYAMNYVQEEFNKMFSSLARSSQNNKYCKITYKPGKKISYTNNPIEQREQWTLDITCEKCNTSYSVIGSAYFCPNCGYNNVLNSFENSMMTIDNMLNSQEEMYSVFSKIYDNDKATIMCQKLLESSLGDIVSAFQYFAYELFKTKMLLVKFQPNDFQKVDVGDQLFNKNYGIQYTNYITVSEKEKMNKYFNQRHVIEHLNGIVDEKYISNSQDTNYKIGQRLVIKTKDVKELLKIINKLCSGLDLAIRKDC